MRRSGSKKHAAVQRVIDHWQRPCSPRSATGGWQAGSLPRGHDFVRALEALTGTTATWDTHDEMMVKGVNWPALQQKVGGEFVPDGLPEDEAAFWRDLLGTKPFYSWADIF